MKKAPSDLKKFVKAGSLILAVLLILTLSFSLAACGKQREQKRKQLEAQERAQSVFEVEDALLGALGEGWRKGMNDSQIAALNDAGDYIVAEGWMSVFGQTLLASDMQTAKLKVLASKMQSSDGQALLTDFANNAELLLPLFKEVGFTQEDLGGLAYGMLRSLVTESGNALNEIYTDLLRVRDLVTDDSNIVKNVSSVLIARQELVPTSAKRQELLTSFEEARGALEALVGFAYNIFVNTLTDDLNDAIFGGDGALADITDGEVNAVVNSLTMNVSSLKNALGEGERAKLNRALDLVIENFDKDSISSVLYAQVVEYAKYAYMFVDAIPMICDLLTAAGETVVQNVSMLRQNIDALTGDDAVSLYNVSVLTAKVIKSFMDDNDAQTMSQFFKGMFDLSGSESPGLVDFDMDKAALIVGIDVALNLVDLIGPDEQEIVGIRHDDLLTPEDLGRMINSTFFLRKNLYKFQEAYYRYLRGEITLNALYNASLNCNFFALGVDNPYYLTYEGGSEVAKLWYEYYMINGMQAANRLIADLAVKAEEDIERFIEDHYAEGSKWAAALERAAALEMRSDMTDEEVESALMGFADSGVIGFVAVMQLAGLIF